MATPDPEGFSLLSKVLAAATAIAVPLGTFYKLGSSALAKKADKAEVDKQFSSLNAEMGLQRGNVGKLFDQIRENEQRAQDRHERLMEKIK